MVATMLSLGAELVRDSNWVQIAHPSLLKWRELKVRPFHELLPFTPFLLPSPLLRFVLFHGLSCFALVVPFLWLLVWRYNREESSYTIFIRSPSIVSGLLYVIMLYWTQTGQPQHTISSPIKRIGVGLHTGERATIKLLPASADEGRYFVNLHKEADKGDAIVLAHIKNVSQTRLSTCLGRGQGAIQTVEHLLSALEGLGVDNCRIEIEGGNEVIFFGHLLLLLLLLRLIFTLACYKELLTKERKCSCLRFLLDFLRFKPLILNSELIDWQFCNCSHWSEVLKYQDICCVFLLPLNPTSWTVWFWFGSNVTNWSYCPPNCLQK